VKARAGFLGPDTELATLFKTKIEASGLTLKETEKLGMAAVRTRLWGTPAKPALEIGYFEPMTGQPMLDAGKPFVRYRVLPEPPPGGAKYLQSSGTAPHAYFPRGIDWSAIFSDPTKELLITEGELKAAAATKHGFPTVGLGGVDSFRSKKFKLDLLPELAAIAWERRLVIIVFDSDASSKPGVRRARQALADQLIARGAEVRTVDPPPGSNDRKIGLDDFLVAQRPEALRALLAQAEKISQTPDWMTQLHRGPGGGAHAHHANVMIALRGAPELNGVFAFDEMDQSAMVLSRLPGELGGEFPHPISDADEMRLLEWLQSNELTRLTRGVLSDAITARAHEESFHPVRDFLNGLSWDGTPRLGSWLAQDLGASGDSEYLAEVGRLFLIALVARVMKPGCKADYVVVLEGPQGAGKSTACRILTGERWFSDGMPDLHQDQVRLSQHLRGRWLIEIAELAAMSKAESDDLKAFLTRCDERYTPKYGRREVVEPRQCLFIGTTNAGTYLRDETGGRRFWPVTVGTIDLGALGRDRDQLLAEAVALYRAGERWWPDAELEKRVFRPEQEARADTDPWHEIIAAWLPDPKRPPTVSIMAIACGPLMLEPGSVTRMYQNRIKGILTQLRWEVRRSNGVRTWWPKADATVKPADLNATPAGARRVKPGVVVKLEGTRRR
jgi:predicted P-loop ATPase